MKKLILIFLVAIVLIGGYITYRVLDSKDLSPKKISTFSYNGLDLKVIYCSPSKRGRVIFGDSASKALVPNRKYWRMGANDATEITLSKNVSINDKSLPAGSYRLYAVPNEASWQISFNSELGKWGYDEPNYSKDVLKVEVPVEKKSAETEMFTISFTTDSVNVNMNLDWDKTHVQVPMKLNP